MDKEYDLETGEELVKDLPEGEEHEEEYDDDEEETLKTPEPKEGEEGEGEEEGTDDEREAIRARRRQERKDRKQHHKDLVETLRRELSARDSIIDELRSRQDAIERRSSGSELAQLEKAKQEAAQAYTYYRDQIAEAVNSSNGAMATEATERMQAAQRRFDELQNYEKALKSRQAAPQALDPRLVNHAQSWMNANKWYDPAGKDTDSRVVLTLDNQLAAEGWNPTTKEYWDELDARVKKYLHHRATGDKITRNKPRSVVSGGSRESSSSKGRDSYSLSAERVKSLKDAGLWDDPKKRAEAIKRFRDWDQQNKA